jgi:electron transfer flavoprotein alpha subunit
MRAAIFISSATSENQARELISAARAAGADDIHLWVFREDAQRFAALPARELLAIQAGGALIAERYLPALVTLCRRANPYLVLLADGFLGDELAVRLGCRLEGSAASGIIQLSSEENNVRIVRRVYGSRLEAEFVYSKPPYVFSVARESYAADDGVGNPKLWWSDVCLADADWLTDCVETAPEEVLGLEAFSTVLVGGRGIGGTSNMEKLAQLAEALGAGVGATRPVVYNGWFPLNRMVGLSGARIKPKLCITFGASGAIPLVKGIEGSDLLVAINNDANAPIFDYCDVGIVDDCIASIAELAKLAGTIAE